MLCPASRTQQLWPRTFVGLFTFGSRAMEQSVEQACRWQLADTASWLHYLLVSACWRSPETRHAAWRLQAQQTHTMQQLATPYEVACMQSFLCCTIMTYLSPQTGLVHKMSSLVNISIAAGQISLTQET